MHSVFVFFFCHCCSVDENDLQGYWSSRWGSQRGWHGWRLNSAGELGQPNSQKPKTVFSSYQEVTLETSLSAAHTVLTSNATRSISSDGDIWQLRGNEVSIRAVWDNGHLSKYSTKKKIYDRLEERKIQLSSHSEQQIFKVNFKNDLDVGFFNFGFDWDALRFDSLMTFPLDCRP